MYGATKGFLGLDGSYPGIEALLTKNFALSPADELVIVYDAQHKEALDAVVGVARRQGLRHRAVRTAYAGEPDFDVRLQSEILERDGPFLFLTKHNPWHTPTRKKAKHEQRKRLAALICPLEELTQGGATVDPELLTSIIDDLEPLFLPGVRAEFSAASGTRIEAVIGTPPDARAFFESGDYSKPGTGGDYPCGEIGFGPETGSVNGVIVYDLKVQHLGYLREPLILEVQNDKVVSITGHRTNDFRKLMDDWDPVLRYVSEVSLGINPKAGCSSDPGSIIEEKQLGTVHFGHGGNASYGARTGPHFDGVVSLGSVKVGGVEVLRRGKLMAGAVVQSAHRLSELGDFVVGEAV